MFQCTASDMTIGRTRTQERRDQTQHRQTKLLFPENLRNPATNFHADQLSIRGPESILCRASSQDVDVANPDITTVKASYVS